MKSSSMLAILLAAAALAMADAATNPPARPAKTMRVMAIGNSFSRDALTHLPFIAEAAGHRPVAANAIILDNPYRSPYVAEEDTPVLKRVAHAVVGEGRRSPMTTGEEMR